MKKYLISIVFIFIFMLVITSSKFSMAQELDYIYLSDVSYIEDKSFAGNGNKIRLDQNNDKKTIMLNIEGIEKPFIKGVTAWGTSELVYDLSQYSFDYFVSYIGVDASEKSTYFNTGVKFYIYTSNNDEDWGDPIYTSEYLDASTPAEYVKIDIENVKYLKLVADDNSDSWWSAWYDEAVYANAKLIQDTYVEDTSTAEFIKTPEEYDQIIKNNYSLDNEIKGDYELTLLQRAFVNNVGYDTLQAFVKVNEDYEHIIKWLMEDADNLRMYIMGGTPDGSYVNSLRVLRELYDKYQDDLNDETITTSGIKLKDLYKKMMITLSLTHSTDVGLWVTGPSGNPLSTNDSYAINRYSIFKNLYQEGLLETSIFENLEVEEMRFVMNNIIDDEEIEWLNAYSREKNSLDPYSYITYRFGYDYYKSDYYDQDKFSMWDNRYNLSKYNITYAENFPKLWVVFEEGGVCGAISKTGSNLRGVYGVPSTVVGQPGHAAYIYYYLNDNNEGVWTLYNDISGWAMSDRTEKLGIRMPNGWGIGSYASPYPVTYILLAQANLNDFDNYQKSEEILLLANTYATDNDELYSIYRASLAVNPINFDAWLNLVNLYLIDSSKKENDYIKLAEEIATNLKFYPLPMYDLLRLIEPKITSNAGLVQFTLLRQNTLTEASIATNEQTIQQQAVRQVANYLLGNIDSKIATFSFDGDKKNTIILSEEKFGTSGVVWEYSLDGKNTWNQTNIHQQLLTDEELDKINAENDINIHIVGTSYDDANIYTIDITRATLPTDLYNNDYENRIVGTTDKLEWMSEDRWIAFSDETPDLSGNQAIIVRVASAGTSLSSESKTYYFTENTDTDTYKYVSIDRLTIADVSTEETGRNEGAANAIDGNLNTMWHTLWNGSDTEKYITIKLDKRTYISGIEYFQRQDTGSNGKVLNAKILVSEDGENWIEAISSTEWDMSKAPKKVEFNESISAQYIKIIGVNTSGSYMAAAMINVYEDITKLEETPSETPEENPDDEPDLTPEENPDKEDESNPDDEEQPTPDDSNKDENNQPTDEPDLTPEPTPTPDKTPNKDQNTSETTKPNNNSSTKPSTNDTSNNQDEDNDKEETPDNNTDSKEEPTTTTTTTKQKENVEDKSNDSSNNMPIIIISIIALVGIIILFTKQALKKES